LIIERGKKGGEKKRRKIVTISLGEKKDGDGAMSSKSNMWWPSVLIPREGREAGNSRKKKCLVG